MDEQLTVEIEGDLKKALLRYCKARHENPNTIVGRAVREFIAKTPGNEEETWFGLSATDYFALADEKRDALWNRAYGREFERHQPREQDVRADARTPGQRSRETLRRRLREIREKPSALP
jgi:predicted transcriptional regulator